jgi:hypothetical protein
MENILPLHLDEKPPNCIAEECGVGLSIVKLNLLPEILNFYFDILRSVT